MIPNYKVYFKSELVDGTANFEFISCAIAFMNKMRDEYSMEVDLVDSKSMEVLGSIKKGKTVWNVIRF